MSERLVVFVIYPGFQVLDLTGPHEVFSQAVRLTPGSYRMETAAAAGGAVRAGSGLGVVASMTTAECAGDIDTLVVVGGTGRDEAVLDGELIGWIASAAGRSRRVASVCGGAFLLAAAGLLDGRRAVTHWAGCERLAREYPRVTVDPDPIFVRDGNVWTSAGITAGMDLALALVEEDLGAETARAIARRLVMFVQRPGGQAQFSAQLAAQAPSREPLRELVAWIAENLDADLSVPALAERAGMSERHFARVFAAQTGRTPAAYVEDVRLEAARRLLETTGTTVDRIARTCGFGTSETMYRVFRRTVGVSPGQYRRHFTSRMSAIS
ncbi:GlxA family transcriptional regulator [Bailinhaonella thermotolerans]|uniref:Helix-turn-helix domain-containing protein n=1 Tax=Bailinhaonella thermotolerans TaxID=1070861 RepID=A0A3A4B477_9ACTN|nr:helix-turn-helix domain-containing protein [Bailinhaonella thermotolerans]RJL32170.1 helix-turn-helix domain-containing protein [Bailinhaonella thermotolerans]